MQSAFDDYYTQADNLKDAAARKKYLTEKDPSAEYVDQLKEFAQKHQGTHAGLMALRRLVLLGAGGGTRDNPRDLGKRFALTQLIDYERSPELPEIMRYLASGNTEPAVEGFLRDLIGSKTASDGNRVFARYMLARWQLDLVGAHEYWERRLKELDDGDKLRYSNEREYLQTSLSGGFSSQKLANMEREAISSLESLTKSSSNVRQPAVKAVDDKWLVIRVAPEKTQSMPLVTDLATGLLFEQKHLKLGRPAPDLEVSLVNGELWSLAQQRGRTVIIQFSFKGCGPCEEMYPDLKTLQEKFPDSLSILSIMADEEKSDTTEAVHSGKLTWNVCWDGYRGPIATKWAVNGFPTVYVVGPNGKIAGRGLRGEALKSKVAQLTKPLRK
ncbi:MAG: redoxin domain-containing protein [Planctomycetaceae bacterium]|nr:redoxin domain-containing protein [Planctomycetaceae bacterium]